MQGPGVHLGFPRWYVSNISKGYPKGAVKVKVSKDNRDVLN